MLLWIDGFDAYGTTVGSAPLPTGVVARKYPLLGSEVYMDVRNGRYGGYSIQLVYDSTCYCSPGALTTDSTMVIGFALKIPTNWPTDNLQFLRLYDGTTQGVNLRLRTSGELSVYNSTTFLGTTSGAAIGLGAWVYIELKVVCGDSGSYEVCVDGVSRLSGSGDTKAGTHNYHTTFYLVGNGGTDLTKQPYIDDLYCLDGSGTVNNDFLGDHFVQTLFPNAVGDVNAWTGSTGVDHYTLVDENPADSTSYVESETPTQEELWGYDVPTGLGVVAGVCVNTDCCMTGATGYTLQTQVKNSGTDSSDTGQAISSASYLIKTRLLESNPCATGVWDSTLIADTQFGVKVV